LCSSTSITLSQNATATVSNIPVYVNGLLIDFGTGYYPLDGTHGAEFDGPASSCAGNGVKVGDINGDGIVDLMVDAPSNTVGGVAVGSIYVYFGRKTGWPASAYSLGNL